MKLAYRITIGIISSIMSLLALVFIVIEARLLFSGDWIIYDNAAAGFIKYLFRLLIACGILTKCVFEFINIKKMSKTINLFLFVSDIAIVIAFIPLMITGANYVPEVGFLIALVCVFAKLLLATIAMRKDSVKE